MTISFRMQTACVAALCVLMLLIYGLSVDFRTTGALSQVLRTSETKSKSKNAFCAFLAEPEPDDAIKNPEEDYYFVGTRMLIYQTLHDPETKTNTAIPFVVLVTENVEKWKRDRLVLDGASVIEVSSIKVDWVKPRVSRWTHVMDKLHVFELVKFDKVLLFDSDVVVLKRLDSLFDEHNALPNLEDPSNIRDDEAPQPSQYLMAGNSGPVDRDHEFPGERGDRLNAGFVLFKPSLEMFQHYLSVANIEGRFPGDAPEQDLWNYVHRRDGNMPWKQIDFNWTINKANYGDYEHGVATLHEKYWRLADKNLANVLLRIKWKMEGFFEALQS